MTGWLLIAALLSGPAEPAASAAADPAVVRLIAELSERVAASPDDAAAHAELGLACEANLLWEQAHRAFAAAVEREPGEPLWRLHLAIAAREIGELEAAERHLEAVVETAPDLAPALQRLAMARLEQGEIEDAKTLFARLVALQPASPEARTGLGDALLRAGEPERAAAELERALSYDPGYRSAHYLLGQAYRALGRTEEAKHRLAFGQGGDVRYVPGPLTPRVQEYAVNLTASLERAAGELGAGRPEQAVELLEAVRRDHPENVTVLNNLAIARMHQGDLDGAHRLLTRALEINDEKFSTYLNLSSWAQRRGRMDEAVRYAEAAVERGPNVAQAHAVLGGLLVRLGRTDEAIESFRTAIRLDFRDPRNYLAISQLELRRDGLEATAEYAGRAVGLWPDLLPAQQMLFEAQAGLGRLDEAKATLAELRRLAPGHPGIAELEGRLMQLEEESEP